MATVSIRNYTQLPIHAATSFDYVVHDYKNYIAPGTKVDLNGTAVGQDIGVTLGTKESEIKDEFNWLTLVGIGAAILGAITTIAGIGLTIATAGAAAPTITAGAAVFVAVWGGISLAAGTAVTIGQFVVNPCTISNCWGPDGYDVTVWGGKISGEMSDDGKTVTITNVDPIKVYWVNRTSHTTGGDAPPPLSLQYFVSTPPHYEGNQRVPHSITSHVIGNGGDNPFKFLFSGGNGILYAVNNTGQLQYFKHTAMGGTGNVMGPATIGLSGWDQFMFLFSGGNGIIYAVNKAGQLLFYQDTKMDGTGDVANPKVIGQSGWDQFTSVFSAGKGYIHAVTKTGGLLRYQDKNMNGTGDVANPQQVGTSGWDQFSHFSGAGVWNDRGNTYATFMAVDKDGFLRATSDRVSSPYTLRPIQDDFPVKDSIVKWKDLKYVFADLGGGGVYGGYDHAPL